MTGKRKAAPSRANNATKTAAPDSQDAPATEPEAEKPEAPDPVMAAPIAEVAVVLPAPPVEETSDGTKPAAKGNGATNDPKRTTKAHRLEKIRQDPEAIRQTFESGKYPYTTKMRRTAYEKHKADLQLELLKVQEWVKNTNQKIVLIFEGRDAAG